MSNANFVEVGSPENFQKLLSTDLKRISIINFWAPWAEPCLKMNEVVKELAKKYPAALFLQVCVCVLCAHSKTRRPISCLTHTPIYRLTQVEAEEQPDIAESFDIEAVPAFIILQVRMCWNDSENQYCLKFPGGYDIGSHPLGSYSRCRRCNSHTGSG